MSIIAFPSTLFPKQFTWGQERRDLAFTSLFGSQSVGVAGALWRVTMEQPNVKDSDAGAWQALLLKLAGKVNQLELWNIMRPAPLGTMRGTMTLNSAASQGAVSLSVVASGENAKTLKQGDLLGLGSGFGQQVVMVMDDATSNGSGVIAVNIQPPLRAGYAGGASVVWDKPKALFRQVTPKASWNYAPGAIVSGIALDLVEDWRS